MAARSLFASHAERYSRVKNDAHLHPDLIAAARRWGEPEQIVWYERPLLKRTRKLYAGQHKHVWRADGAAYLSTHGLKAPVRYVGHHQSHAAAGFFTSPFDHAAILVVDAIGEWSTISAWEGRGRSLKQLWGQRYPHSLGLLYSAFTQRIGFKPNEEEYILMGAAALGEPRYVDLIDQDFVRREIGAELPAEGERPSGCSLVASGDHGQLEHRRLDTGDHRGVSRWPGRAGWQAASAAEPRADGRIGAQLRGKQQDRARRRLRQDLDHAESRRRGFVAWRGGSFRRASI